ncbi:MAG: exodeoxyribonuclease VII small subunit [Planctomycetes bacterium]|nr:exodeoxyribonuclease VII small subunit [Planctomycetota bacterium]
MPKETSKKSFQARQDELAAIVQQLDAGTLSLEDSVARFEEGRRLHQELVAELAAYEQRLETLTRDTETPADADGDHQGH